MAAYNNLDTAAAATTRYGPGQIGVPPWVPRYVAGGAAAPTASAQPPSRGVSFQGREGARKCPEEVVSELLNKLGDRAAWKLAEELVSLGVAKLVKVKAVRQSGMEGDEGDDGGDRKSRPKAKPVSSAPPPAQASAPPWCPPGAAGSAPSQEAPPLPYEMGAIPPERLARTLHEMRQLGLQLSELVARYGAAVAEQQQQQQRRQQQQRQQQQQQRLQAHHELPPAPWNFTPPLRGMPPPPPPCLLMAPHLLDDTRNSQCRPFLADESIERLSKDEQKTAQKQTQEAADAENLASEVPCTTFLVRNLPASISGQQEVAREWLDNKGFKGEYDFFMLFTGKKERKVLAVGDSAKQPPRTGYFIVNFKDVAAGQRCRGDLDGQHIDDSGGCLGVVATRKQGLDNLLLHFGGLGESGGGIPRAWIDRGG